MISAKLIASLFGAVFLLVGLLGFTPNPIVSPDGIFVVNAMHNLVHILTGAAFLAGVYFGYPRATTLGIGVYYIAVALIGLMTEGDMLLGFIHINTADRWLHVGLAVVILAAGFVASRKTETAAYAIFVIPVIPALAGMTLTLIKLSYAHPSRRRLTISRKITECGRPPLWLGQTRALRNNNARLSYILPPGDTKPTDAKDKGIGRA